MQVRMERACRGWLAALPLVLAGPAGVWLIVPLLVSGLSGDVIQEHYAWGLRFIPSFIFSHLLGFLFLGLPLFLKYWHLPGGFWRPAVIFPVGIALGSLASIPTMMFLGRNIVTGAPIYFIFPAYGFLSALGSWFAHRRDLRLRPITGECPTPR